MRHTLISATSVLALMVSAAANAQVCTPDPPSSGDTVTCTAGTYGQIVYTTVDDLTLVVGDGGSATTITTNGIWIETDAGNIDLTVYNAGTTITQTGFGPNGAVYLEGRTNTVNITGNIEGAIYGNRQNGLDIRQDGTGYVNVTVASVYGVSVGIGVYTQATSTSLDITATGAVSSGLNAAVNVIHRGSGDANISLTDVTGLSNSGISAGSLAHDVGMTVTATGLVTGTGSFAAGIGANSRGAVTVNANNVSGVSVGVNAVALNASGYTNTNDINVTVTGSITASNGRGIYVRHNGSGAVNLDVNNVTASAGDGIFVRPATGSVDIITRGAISATGDGIEVYANSSSAAGTISLTTYGTVSGNVYGVRLLSQGQHNFDVTVNETITATTRGFRAFGRNMTGESVFTFNAPVYSGSTAISIQTIPTATGNIALDVNTDLVASTQAIYVDNRGTGNVTAYVQSVTTTSNQAVLIDADQGSIYLRATGDLVSQNARALALEAATGIVAYTQNLGESGAYSGRAGYANAAAGDVTVTVAGNIYGGNNVNTAFDVGTFTGNTTLTVNNIYSSAGSGVTATAGQHLDLDVLGTVNTGTFGIFANGPGAYSSQAVDVVNLYANSATGGIAGLISNAAAAGNMNMTITGVGQNDGGAVFDLTHSGTGNVYVTTGTSTTGYTSGVVIDANGGLAQATLNGIVTGTTEFGAETSSTAGGVQVNVAAGATVTGERQGIRASSATGSVVTVGAGASVSTNRTVAILTADSTGAIDAPDTLVIAGSVTGDIRTRDGGDIFVLESTGLLSAGSTLDLGTGDDVLTLNTDLVNLDQVRAGLDNDTINIGFSGTTWTGSGRVGDQIRQFEIMNLSGLGITLAGTHFNYAEANIESGVHILTGRLYADVIAVDAGATLDLADGGFATRTSFNNNGTLTVGGAGTTGAGNIVGVLNMDAAAELNIDALGVGDNDLLRVLGPIGQGWGVANLDGTLNLNQTYGLEEGTYIVINAVNGINGTFAAVNGLGSGAGLEQSLVYNAATNTVRVRTSTVAMSAPLTGSKSSASASNYLLSQLGNGTEYSQLGFEVGTMGSVAEIGTFASGITPDVLDSAVLVSDGAAMRFSQSLSGCDMNFSLNSAESCAAVAGQDGPAFFGEIRQTSANTGTEVGHNFNAQSFDMSFGVRLTDADDAVQFGLMSGYAKSGSVSDAYYAPNANSNTPCPDGVCNPVRNVSVWGATPDRAEPADGLQAETFSLGAYARRDLGWWSLDGAAMVSTSEAKLVRNIIPGLGIAEQAQSEFVSRQFNLQGTATLNGLGNSEFAIKPLATFGNRILQRDGFTESGADLLGLTVNGQTRNISYAGIGAEFAPDFTDDQGNGFRGLVRVTGLAYAGDTDSDFTARFTNAPGDDSFTYFGQNLDTSVLFEGGFQYLAPNGFAIGAEGFGEVNPETGDSSTVGATLQLIKRW